ncbi:5'-methylthioadenosine nucleosidase isoform X2 [Daucus carota subsp. sativus]|uniref:5'-methylthioadenosine nucleosidase isoform X2 n=1 Tax=Daucus carota subsp. sativus TaxID=79200 RepID=UPI0007EFFFA4|nr:PREDICTED: 5'-methylthioadenosine/S-adenosylhomocysteine nucleosidase 1-like isoform X2 [Daucus carota subsp. sativus]
MTPPAESLPTSKRPISTIAIIMAMQTEALPLIDKFHLSLALDSLFPNGVPWVRYHGTYNDLYINIVLPGKDVVLGVDNVGTVCASLITYASIQALQPDLIINAGTAGGFKAKGACIGDVFLVSEVAFHDRRIPIPLFDLYGVGQRQAFSTPNMSKDIKLKVYVVCYRPANCLLETLWICAQWMNHLLLQMTPHLRTWREQQLHMWRIC